MPTDNEDRLEHILKELVCYATTVNGCVDETSNAWKSWQKTDPEERGNPPHVIAGWRLDGEIDIYVALVLNALRDTRPELAKHWDISFKELFADNGKIIDDWKSGCDSYNASLEKAFSLSFRVTQLAHEVDAHAQELANEPSAGDEKALSIPEAAKRLSINRSTLYRWRDAKPPRIPLSIFVTIGGREKVVESKLAAWILEKSEESQRKLSDT